MARKVPKDPLVVILGATGTGKSQLAIDLATRFNGEIINGDAMQMYDGLPIITNKITVTEQKGIPHHLLGFIALDEEPWRVGLFKKKAGQIIQEIRSRGRLPILVGGTHYYTQSLLFKDALVCEELAGAEAIQPEISNEEIARRFPILEGPVEAVMERLRQVDPVMAERWHPNDTRKIRRSLEIFLLTGKKASDIYKEQKENNKQTTIANQGFSEDPITPMTSDTASTLLFWVYSESETLKKRLDARVDKMLEAGLLEEVKSMNGFLRDKERDDITVDRSRGIWISIGWKEFEPYLAALASGTGDQGTLNNLLSMSIEQTKAATRQYAKRQIRWIRLKLIPALSSQNALDNLYLLDGTDLSQWTSSVSDPAIHLTANFLAGEHLRAPGDLSDAAKEHLTLEKSIESTNGVRHECEMCHTITVTEEQWQAHLKSRTHRRLVKKEQKLAYRGRSPVRESAYISAPPNTP